MARFIVGVCTGRPGVFRPKVERNAIHAITKAGRLRAVVEDMAEMAATAGAMDLGADKEKEAAVFRRCNRPIERRPETRPPRPTFKLRACGEQRQAAPGTYIGARPVLLVERACPRALGLMATKHGVLLGGKLVTPFLIRLDHLEFPARSALT